MPFTVSFQKIYTLLGATSLVPRQRIVAPPSLAPAFSYVAADVSSSRGSAPQILAPTPFIPVKLVHSPPNSSSCRLSPLPEFAAATPGAPAPELAASFPAPGVPAPEPGAPAAAARAPSPPGVPRSPRPAAFPRAQLPLPRAGRRFPPPPRGRRARRPFPAPAAGSCPRCPSASQPLSRPVAPAPAPLPAPSQPPFR
jgi:hypothetical protein